MPRPGAALPTTLLALLIAMPGVTPARADEYREMPATEVQLSRYQVARARPRAEQLDPLQAIVTHDFGEQILTLGEAIEDLLRGSGYRLLSAELAAPDRVSLFSLPLPEPQRRLGPMPLEIALEVLSGPAFRLVVEPVYRLVSFERVSRQAALASADTTDGC